MGPGSWLRDTESKAGPAKQPQPNCAPPRPPVHLQTCERAQPWSSSPQMTQRHIALRTNECNFKPLDFRLIYHAEIANLNNAYDKSLEESKDSSFSLINLMLKKGEILRNTLKHFLITEN